MMPSLHISLRLLRVFVLAGMLLSAGLLRAQITDFDLQTTSDRDLIGTTRYVGMAGAMAAVGGDPSAVRDNPAALGVYRRDELSLTFDYQQDKCVGASETPTPLKEGKISVGQVSWNFNFDNLKLHGVVANNLMLGYHRLKNFNRSYAVGGRELSASQTDVMALLASGHDTTALYSSGAWGDVDLPWLSVVGAELGFIVPDGESADQWVSSDMNKLSASLNVTELGYVDEYSISWGMNLSNKVYIGADASLRNLVYSKTAVYTEQFTDSRFYRLTSYQVLSGVGVNASVGVLYRPVRMLRLGLAVHTPSLMAISYQNSVSYSNRRSSETDSGNTHNYSEDASSYRQPMRLVLGAALQFSRSGLLSFEYDLTHAGKKAILDDAALTTADRVATNTHFIKLGSELVLKNNFFFNFGYAYKVRPSVQRYYPNFNSTRFDTDFRNLVDSHYITAGFSYRQNHVIVGLAYQCRLSGYDVFLHEQSPGFSLSSTTHKAVLTVAWHEAR